MTTETAVWYQSRDAATDELWCETRDPDDPYLLPAHPDQRLIYRKITFTYTPNNEVTEFTPSAELLAKGHPTTWSDDEDED